MIKQTKKQQQNKILKHTYQQMIWRVIGIIPSWQICFAVQESGWAGTSRLNIKITWQIWQHVKKNDLTSKNTEQNNKKNMNHQEEMLLLMLVSGAITHVWWDLLVAASTRGQLGRNMACGTESPACSNGDGKRDAEGQQRRLERAGMRWGGGPC